MEWTWYYHRPTKTSRIQRWILSSHRRLEKRSNHFPKYSGRVKYLGAIPHVIVFANWKPNFSKLSRDRWVLRQIKVADLISQEEIPVTPQMWDECILHVRHNVRPTNIKKYRTSVLYLSDGLGRRFAPFCLARLRRRPPHTAPLDASHRALRAPLYTICTLQSVHILHYSRSRGNSIDNQILHRSQACSKTRNRQINICSHLSGARASVLK